MFNTLTIMIMPNYIKEFSVIPNNHCDMVINTDVLEHIPKNDIADVLNHIKSLSNNIFFCLHHGKAYTILPNGENAHITVEPKEWYHSLMKKYFDNFKSIFDIINDIRKDYENRLQNISK